jgi:hypothetical protein
MEYAKDYFFARRTMTKHRCAHCEHVFYVRASFYTCPACNKENQQPVFLNALYSFPALVGQLMKDALRATADKEKALARVQRTIPGYSIEAIKTIWEEVEPYGKD